MGQVFGNGFQKDGAELLQFAGSYSADPQEIPFGGRVLTCHLAQSYVGEYHVSRDIPLVGQGLSQIPQACEEGFVVS